VERTYERSKRAMMSQMHASCCRAKVNAMRQLSHLEFMMRRSSCSSMRVDITLLEKQQHTSSPRHSSGDELS
jgi:hypothetical protein